VCGQQSTAQMIGFLIGGSRMGREHFVGAFRESLKDGGFVEGKMSSSSIAGRMAGTTAFQHLPTSWSVSRSPTLLRLVATPLHSQLRPPRVRSQLSLATQGTPWEQASLLVSVGRAVTQLV